MNGKALLTLCALALSLYLLFYKPQEQGSPNVPQSASAPAATPVSAPAPQPVAVPVNTPQAPQLPPPPQLPVTYHNGKIQAGVTSSKFGGSIVLRLDSAYSLSQLEAAKAKAQAEHKPLGFIMVWGQYFGNDAVDCRGRGGPSGTAHFYRAFKDTLVLVYVRHETELGAVPAAVKQGFNGPDEGGFAPNMAVVDASAKEFIVEIPYGGNNSNGAVRDEVFTKGAQKIEQWLAYHPDAMAAPTPAAR